MKNVLGTNLMPCSMKPITGFYRDGFCRTDENDRGRHVVACIMTDRFLAFTKSKGNDLSSPNELYNFPGLKNGDRWCVCAIRWREAYDAGYAPLVILESTHEKALEIIDMEMLLKMSANPKSVN